MEKTWATLSRGGFGHRQLLLVVPQAERDAYLWKVPMTVKVVGCPVRSLVAQRKMARHITEEYKMIFIDDDIEAIRILDASGQFHHASCNEVETAFEMGLEHTNLCGVYPVANRGWMKRTVSINNAYIVGALYAIRNTPDLAEPNNDEMEDWARQLAEQAAGRPVCRLNYLAVQTKYWKNPGGLQTERTVAKRIAAVDAVAASFQELVRKVTRKNGLPDLRFLNRSTQLAQDHPSQRLVNSTSGVALAHMS
ncbi:hypothetical protein EBZ38_08305 [bacterium]|nr:hypothetical protein [bacterium]NDD84257.1 hypothetical protein [bacterium]